ncbi:hypothetical protein BD410DRAFT_837202 [Rickenella mellea]|uniref:Uncharacterized protein n=1 Tax=Rickenella mellea TaxID=50990 RepID=A0A4Y7QFT3_9AGAM|nr:hypothetical protein BD410DRAFT_837202 [Rickenella mellea]
MSHFICICFSKCSTRVIWQCRISEYPFACPKTPKDITKHSVTAILYNWLIVDRSILGKMQVLEEGNTDNILRPSLVRPKNTWPPPVYKFPELLQHSSQPRARASDSISYDLSFCDSYPCRFVVPSWLPEQGSAAKNHLIQIAEMSIRLNRTLVLPNVGKNRIGTCFKNAFATYYDSSELLRDRGGTGLRTVTLDAFTQWVSGRPKNPIGQIVVVESQKAASEEYGFNLDFEYKPTLLQVGRDSDPSLARHKHCLTVRIPRLTFGPFPKITIKCAPSAGDGSDGEMAASISSSILLTLGGADTFRDFLRVNRLPPTRAHDVVYGTDSINPAQTINAPIPDVFVLDWDIRRPIFPSSVSISYSPRLKEFATRIAPEDPSFVTVHWQSDSLPVIGSKSCAEELVNVVQLIIAQAQTHNDSRSSAHTVWLMNDYPTPLPQSYDDKITTWKNRSPPMSTNNRIRTLLQTTFSKQGILNSIQVIGVADALAAWNDSMLLAVGMKREWLEDQGALEIIDLMVANNAAMFVSASNGSCGRVGWAN